MPMTVANQRIIKIHRASFGNKFLGIKTENFAKAYQDLNATATILYLYIANNKDGFDLAFSPRAVAMELGMAESTTRDQFRKLIQKGYLVRKNEGSNIYDFYEVPKREETKAETQSEKADYGFEAEETVAASSTDFDF